MNLILCVVPAIALAVLLISIIAKKMEWFINFLTRVCVGGLALYITSEVMLRLSMPCSVGVNSTTLSTVGLLGIPGYLLILSIEALNSIK